MQVIVFFSLTRLFWHSDVDLSPGHTNTRSIYPTQNLFFMGVYIIIYIYTSKHNYTMQYLGGILLPLVWNGKLIVIERGRVWSIVFVELTTNLPREIYI